MALTKNQQAQRFNQVEAYPWEWWKNEFIKAEWIPANCQLWMVNGQAGRHSVCVPLDVEDRKDWAIKRYVQLFIDKV